jgi:hypothetical protein
MIFSIAVYFEGEKNSLQAGRFFYRAGEYSKVSVLSRGLLMVVIMATLSQ